MNDAESNKLQPSSSVSSMNDNGNNVAAVEKNDKEKAENVLVLELIDFVSRTETGIAREKQILETFFAHLKALEANIGLASFGSATYGFGGSSTNFNILVNALELNPLTLMSKFEKSFQTPGVQNDFEMLNCLSGNRVQKRRFQLIHKQSNILCLIQFDRDLELVECSQIIRNCIKYTPLCK